MTVGLLAAATNLFPTLLPWLGALLGLVLVGAVAVYLVRRLFRGGGAPVDVGFTLQELRDMHRAGELTDEEFARAKAAMIERVQLAAMPPEDTEPDKID